LLKPKSKSKDDTIKPKRVGKYYASFDDMCWPIPCNELSGLEWRLRYSTPTKSDLLVAASVVSAYQGLIEKPGKFRDQVIKKIKKVIEK